MRHQLVKDERMQYATRKPGKKKKSNHTLHKSPSKHYMEKKHYQTCSQGFILTISTNLTTKEMGWECERHELSYINVPSSGISCKSDGATVLMISEETLAATGWGTVSRKLTICSISVPALLVSCFEARAVS